MAKRRGGAPWPPEPIGSPGPDSPGRRRGLGAGAALPPAGGRRRPGLQPQPGASFLTHGPGSPRLAGGRRWRPREGGERRRRGFLLFFLLLLLLLLLPPRARRRGRDSPPSEPPSRERASGSGGALRGARRGMACLENSPSFFLCCFYRLNFMFLWGFGVRKGRSGAVPGGPLAEGGQDGGGSSPGSGVAARGQT